MEYNSDGTIKKSNAAAAKIPDGSSFPIKRNNIAAASAIPIRASAPVSKQELLHRQPLPSRPFPSRVQVMIMRFRKFLTRTTRTTRTTMECHDNRSKISLESRGWKELFNADGKHYYGKDSELKDCCLLMYLTRRKGGTCISNSQRQTTVMKELFFTHPRPAAKEI